MSESRATIIAGVLAGIAAVTGSGWSCWTAITVQDKQEQSTTLIASMQREMETQRLLLEKQQGELSVQVFADSIKARQEDALKEFLPDVLSANKQQRIRAVVVLTTLYPNEAPTIFRQAVRVADALTQELVEDTHPTVPKKPEPAPKTPKTQPTLPPGSAPVTPKPKPPPVVTLADAISKSTGKWTIRVSMDRTAPLLPQLGGATFEKDLFVKKGLPSTIFETKEGFITTVGVYDSENEAKLVLRTLPLSGRSAYVVSINSLCEKNTGAHALCAAMP